ncbi:MAG: hypothetical protein IJW72_04275 [Alphaproteobacteria bacterium]|nr:hypothetical protein [Alphaproteobacteria bacterium]
MSDDKNSASPLWKRFLLRCLKSPIHTMFVMALLYGAFYIYVLGNDDFYYKMVMLGIVLLWILWCIAKYVLTLILILGVLGIGAYLYYDYSQREVVECEKTGGYWNKKTQKCEEKRSFWQQVEDKWEDFKNLSSIVR